MSFIDYLENTDELVKKFNSTVEFVQQWEEGKKTSNEQKLEAYKYYKQAMIGDINIPEPSFINFTAKSKWNAWNSVKGTEKYDAMIKYIEIIEEQKKMFN
jgi:diazepam-binding inhibitor (GABA receptor modulating acyl-CoA-binding protein)